MTSQSIPISQIYRLPDTQPRTKIDLAIVDEYAEAMKTGAKFPPLDVFKIDKRYIIVDGYHRHRAAENAKIKEFLCHVHEGGMRDAILFAAGANATHGLRRTNEDKHRAVERLLSDKEWSTWSDNEIAKRCSVSNELVAKLREAHYPQKDSEKRAYVTKHGTPAKMDTTKIGRKKKTPSNGTPQPGDFKPKEPLPPPKTLAGNPVEVAHDEAKEKPPVAWSTDVCKSGKCPDGKTHYVRNKARNRMECDCVDVEINQLPHNECPLEWRRRAVAAVFSSAKYFDKPILSENERETFTNTWVRKCLTKEQKGALHEILQTGEFESNLHAIGTLIERTAEQLGGPA